MKKIITLILGLPAIVIFVSEVELGYVWMQAISAIVLVALFMWNTNFGRLNDVR